MTKIAPPHHHGNLRASLIEAGIALLQSGGTAGLTLRRAAALAGVSHAAPAHHFDGLSGLLTAIAAEAFRRFCTTMLQHRDAAPSDPFQQLLGIGHGYLAFARDNAALFQIMFTTAEVDRSDKACLLASAEAYGILRAGCQPFGKGGQIDPELEHAVWSLVHGYALLGLAGPPLEGMPMAPPPFEAHLRRLLQIA